MSFLQMPRKRTITNAIMKNNIGTLLRYFNKDQTFCWYIYLGILSPLRHHLIQPANQVLLKITDGKTLGFFDNHSSCYYFWYFNRPWGR